MFKVSGGKRRSVFNEFEQMTFAHVTMAGTADQANNMGEQYMIQQQVLGVVGRHRVSILQVW